MEKINNQHHDRATMIYSFSKMMERAAYYGVRVVIIIYITGQTIEMDSSEAIKVIGTFTGLVIIFQIIGGFIGDLIIGNKKSIIIGGLLQALGAFSFCYPSTHAIYIGLFLLLAGGGLYTPNILSNFGKSYRSKSKLLDSAFTIFFLAINIGSFIGILFIGYVAEKLSYNIGFITSGALFLISILPILFTKEATILPIVNKSIPNRVKIINIFCAIIVVGIFSFTYQVAQHNYPISFTGGIGSNNPDSILDLIISLLFVPFSIIAIISWSHVYSSSLFKLLLGLILAIIAFGMLLRVSESDPNNYFGSIMTTTVLLAIAEIHVTPVLYSLLTKYSNPKLLAIFMGLSSLPAVLISVLFSQTNSDHSNEPLLLLKACIVILIIICFIITGVIRWNKKQYLPTNKDSIAN